MSFDVELHALTRVPIFSVLDLEALRVLAHSAEPKALRSGDVLFCKGEQSDGGFVVLRGSIVVSAVEGERSRIVRPHALIGEIAMISRTEHMGTATAQEPTETLKISRVLFHRVLKEYPQSALRVRELIAKRLNDFSQQLDAARNSHFS